MKYRKQTIFDYISGNVDQNMRIELENNQEFMLSVIELTRNSKYYYACSEELRKNHNFNLTAYYLLIENEKVIQEIIKILDNKSIDDFDRVEYYILLSNIYDITRKEEYLQYKVNASLLYSNIIEFIDKNKKKSETTFEHLLNKYDNINSLNYFASSMIQDIFFSDGNKSLDAITHQRFKTVEALDKTGRFKFLIDYVSGIDEYLAHHILINQELLNQVLSELSNTETTWDKYLLNLNQDRIYFINKELNKYIKENGKIDGFNYRAYLKELIKSMNLYEELKDLFIEDDIINEYNSDLDFSHTLVEDKVLIKDLNLKELAFILHMKKYITNLFSKDIVLDVETAETINRR